MLQLNIDTNYLLGILKELLNIPSPTGLAEPALAYVEAALQELGFQPRRTPKGVLLADWSGGASDAARAITAHVDTLGAMVKRIKANGRLQLVQLGSFDWNAVEGEGCQIFTREGKAIRGSLLPLRASKHIHGLASAELPRLDETMEVRLDEHISSYYDARDLGIEVGDFVAFDPRAEFAANGFIRARYLDNKACVACLLAAVHAMQQTGLQPAQRTTLHFCDFEEVGHGGAAGFPDDVVELLALDIAPVGEGQASDEFHVTICVKDANGPYHVGFARQLRELARAEFIAHHVDIYPYYGSDAMAYWKAGGDVRVALIGPGVDATHHYERTHLDALTATARLIAAYLCQANKP